MFETTGILNEYVLREIKNYVLPPKQKILMLGMAAVLVALGCATYMIFENKLRELEYKFVGDKFYIEY